MRFPCLGRGWHYEAGPLAHGTALIERAFYRTKYNAARTLAAFGEQMRVETDLEALREHVVEVVRQTMQPAQVSLWLNTPPRRNAANSLEDGRMPR